MKKAASFWWPWPWLAECGGSITKWTWSDWVRNGSSPGPMRHQVLDSAESPECATLPSSTTTVSSRTRGAASCRRRNSLSPYVSEVIPRRKTLPALAMCAPRFQGGFGLTFIPISPERVTGYYGIPPRMRRAEAGLATRAEAGLGRRTEAGAGAAGRAGRRGSGGAAVVGSRVDGGHRGQVDLGDAGLGAKLVAQAGQQAGDPLGAVAGPIRAVPPGDADLAGDQHCPRADDQHLEARDGPHTRGGLQPLADGGDDRRRRRLVGEQLALAAGQPHRDHHQQQADGDAGQGVGHGRAGELVQRDPDQREADPDHGRAVLVEDRGRRRIGGAPQVGAQRQST